MLSKYVEIGNKVQMQTFGKTGEKSEKIYHSSIHEILSEDTMEIAMPIENSKLVLLPVDSEWIVVFYGINGLYECVARIIDRYKSNNVYILVLELLSNLQKYQRREYFRFSCALDMKVRCLEEEDIQLLDGQGIYNLEIELPMNDALIVDISGGGLRFLTRQCYEPESLLYCSYYLKLEEEQKKYEIISKVMTVKKVENRPETYYEHRVQYYNMDKDVRESIIKFIFEEERKSRKKERLL